MDKQIVDIDPYKCQVQNDYEYQKRQNAIRYPVKFLFDKKQDQKQSLDNAGNEKSWNQSKNGNSKIAFIRS